MLAWLYRPIPDKVIRFSALQHMFSRRGIPPWCHFKKKISKSFFPTETFFWKKLFFTVCHLKKIIVFAENLQTTGEIKIFACIFINRFLRVTLQAQALEEIVQKSFFVSAMRKDVIDSIGRGHDALVQAGHAQRLFRLDPGFDHPPRQCRIQVYVICIICRSLCAMGYAKAVSMHSLFFAPKKIAKF